MIGIVGGMGPLAGIDLSEKIVSQTIAFSDQEHIPQILYSFPENIADRTEYLLGNVTENPAFPITNMLLEMEKMRVTVAGIPCNSAHAPDIFGVVREELLTHGSGITLLHMIDEVAAFLHKNYPGIQKTGILGTTGTYISGTYALSLEKVNIEAVNIPREMQTKLHDAIYHKSYGIKATSGNISKASLETLYEAIHYLKEKEVPVIILGCTELPLALTTNPFPCIHLIDSTLILARALVAHVNPDKLKPWNKDLEQNIKRGVTGNGNNR